MDQEMLELVNKAGQLLLKKKNTIAVAESVTSGNLQAIFSCAKNTISFYQGGITVYNIGQKCRHLLVDPIEAFAFNCVSKNISGQMATNVARLFSAHYGIGITGYASPVPEENVEEIFAFISIAKNDKVLLTKKIKAAKAEPYGVQLFYTKEALKLLIAALNK